MIRLLLAEDQAMVRGALAALLELEDDLTVVAQVARGDEVVPAVAQHGADVALMDIEMPGGDGIEATAALARTHPGVRVLVLTTFARPGYLRRAMEAGAAGFLLKTAPVEELAVAIRRVAAGERVVDPGLAAAALAEGESPLTERERDVLAAARGGDDRRARRAPAPVAGDGAQLPVVGDGQGRRAHTRRGRARRRGEGLVVMTRRPRIII
jgi:two-component system response regulator DesR